MKDLDIIIRGFLYKENWSPLSRYRGKLNYTINFLNVKSFYLNLLKELSKKYSISLYFSTYDTTPSNISETLLKEFSQYNTRFLFSPEPKSTQFTTTIKALKYLSTNGNNKLLIRGDLIIKKELIELLKNSKFNKNVKVLFKSQDLVNDTTHLIPYSKVNSMIEFFKKNKFHAHNLHNHVDVEPLLNPSFKAHTYNVPQYYEIYDSTTCKNIIK